MVNCHRVGISHVTDNGELAWNTFEDKEEILARIPTCDIPPHIAKIDISELTDVSDLSGSVYTAEYQDKTHVIKVHEESYQNTDFRAEVEARIRMGNLPHVVGMVGVVVNNSRIPDRSYVQGILLEYCPKGTLKSLLRRSDPPVESSMKKRWAAQIAHGISAIHEAGLIHGDLRCENVVLDENDNARITDISNGSAFMMGWHPVLDRFDDPRRDVYSLAVTIWEIIHDGEDPPSISTALPIDWRGREFGKPVTDLIEHCVVEFADKRPSMATIIETLGAYNICGCKQDMSRDKFNNYGS